MDSLRNLTSHRDPPDPFENDRFPSMVEEGGWSPAVHTYRSRRLREGASLEVCIRSDAFNSGCNNTLQRTNLTATLVTKARTDMYEY